MHRTPPRRTRRLARVPPLALLGLLAGCGDPDERERILLVTTTSVEASGLLEALTTAYHEAQDRYRLSTTAVGSGAALEMGRRGDGDILLTHHPEGEARFAADGLAAEQRLVMTSEFLIVGPATDAAGILGVDEGAEAFRRIAAAGVRFVSRGDDSGTHVKERALWSAAGVEPWSDRPAWYIEAGLGMEETLHMASQMQAVTLSDRGSFLFLRPRLRLRPLLSGDPVLANPYTYTIPNAAPNPAGARHFASWLMSGGQDVIAELGVAEYGQPLFDPAPPRADGPGG